MFDRSAPLPTGGRIDQADGTAWMALYCQNLTQMAVELARDNPMYLEHAQALLENFAWIAAATNHVGADGTSLWDEQDGFFYDVLRRPDASSTPFKVRSIVGLVPLAAATVIGRQTRETGPMLFALFDRERLRRILARVLDEQEFLGPGSRWFESRP